MIADSHDKNRRTRASEAGKPDPRLARVHNAKTQYPLRHKEKGRINEHVL